jgi:hypothetical protein
MNLDTPYLILYAITGAAFVVWLCGLLFLSSATRRAATPAELWEDDEETPVESTEIAVRGLVEVAGQPAELAAKAAGHLAQQGTGMFGSATVLEQTNERVVFECLPHLGGRFLRRGVLAFHALAADRTQIDYVALIPKRNGLLVAGWIFQVLGLIAIVVGFLVMYTWVAPHPLRAVHLQTLQMLHVFHFIWPPFLFGGIYRRLQTYMRSSLDSFVHNLPYLKS